jgi:hypothetical protein
MIKRKNKAGYIKENELLLVHLTERYVYECINEMVCIVAVDKTMYFCNEEKKIRYL